MSDKLFEETLMLHGWPECGPGSVFIETLYQAFKLRLMHELVARTTVNAFEVNGVRLAGAPLIDDSVAWSEALENGSDTASPVIRP